MAELMALRVMGGLCLWCSAVCLTVPGRKEYAYFLAVILLAGVGIDISYRLRDYRFLRLPVLFLPLLGIFLVKSDRFVILSAEYYRVSYLSEVVFLKEHWFVITIVPVLLYLLIISEISGHNLVYWSYKRNFIVGLVLGTVLIFINFLSYHESFDTYFLAFLYVTIGSFCLRQLRLGLTTDNRVKAINGGAMTAMVILCAVLSKLLMRLERLNWTGFFSGIFLVVGYVMQIFATVTAYLSEKTQELYMWAESIFTGKDAKYFDDAERVVQENANGIQMSPWSEKASIILLGVLAVVFILVLIRFLIPRLEKRKLVRRYRRLSRPKFISVQEAGIREKKYKKEKGNRGRIRAAYRQFLFLVLKSGYVFAPGDTSKDIEDLVGFYGEKEEKAKHLREIYLKVRYMEDYEPTAEEVKAAKRIVHEINTK